MDLKDFMRYALLGLCVAAALTGQQTQTQPRADQIRYLPPEPGAVARTVQSKLSDIVSVLDFGAKGLPRPIVQL